MKNKSFKIVNQLKSYHPSKPLLFLLFLIPVIFGIIRSFQIDNDFWFLVNTGKYIFKNGIPNIEPFTIHSNLSFVCQQWLSCLILYCIHYLFGYFGIACFVFILYLIVLFIFYKICMLVSEKRTNISVLLTVFFSFCVYLFICCRPQMFDYIIFLLLFYFLESYIRKRKKIYLLYLPLLSLLLINLHCSSWLLLLAFVFPYLINSFKFNFLIIKSEGYEKKWLFISLLGMIMCGFFNPYGVKAITYYFTSTSKYINTFVYEMKPINLNSYDGIFIYFIIFLILFIYLFKSQRKISIRYFLLYIGTTYLSLKHLKGFSFFTICNIFPLGDYLRNDFPIRKGSFKHSTTFKIIYGIFIFIVLNLFVIYICLEIPKLGQNKLKKAMDYIEFTENADKKSVKIYNTYDNGGYVEYREYKTYIDPRAEVFLKSNNKVYDYFKENYLLCDKNCNINNFLNKYNFDYVIIGNYDDLYKYYFKTSFNKYYEKVYTYKYDKYKLYVYKKANR